MTIRKEDRTPEDNIRIALSELDVSIKLAEKLYQKELAEKERIKAQSSLIFFPKENPKYDHMGVPVKE